MYHLLVTKCRSLVVFALLVVWTAIPALACLPTQGMTQAEMDCCKKMAGDCQKGAGQHPCCKTAVNRTPKVAKVERNISPIQPDVSAALLETACLFEPVFSRAPNSEKLGLPPPGPPGLTSILRI
jgi:hypothetical protein